MTNVTLGSTYGNGNTVAYDFDDLERVKNIYYNNSSGSAYSYTYNMWDKEPPETTEKVVKIRFQENTRSEKGKYSDYYVVNCRK